MKIGHLITGYLRNLLIKAFNNETFFAINQMVKMKHPLPKLFHLIGQKSELSFTLITAKQDRLRKHQ